MNIGKANTLVLVKNFKILCNNINNHWGGALKRQCNGALAPRVYVSVAQIHQKSKIQPQE